MPNMKYQIGDLLEYDDTGTKTFLAIITKYRADTKTYQIHWLDEYALDYFCSYGYTADMLDNDLFWRKLS